MGNDNWEYDAAWFEAWQTRSCPPGQILFGEKTPELADHLELCSACRDMLAAENDTIQLHKKFGSMLKDIYNPHKTTPQSGQVWSLDKSLEGWGPKARYFTAPLVLVLENIDKAAIRVAQIHEIDLFSQEEDIRLGDNFAGYAEQWNTYTLRKSDLAHCWGMVGVEVVTRTLAKHEKQSRQPAENSLLALFRQLEIETGFFFSSQAVNSLMEQYDDSGEKSKAKILQFFNAAPEAKIKKTLLRHNYLQPVEAASKNKIMLLKIKPKEPLCLAAAESAEGVFIQGPLLTVDADQNETVVTVQGRAEIRYRQDNRKLEVDGYLENISCDIDTSHLALGWLCADGKLIITDDYDYYPEDNSFDAIFTDIPSLEGELRICLVDPEYLKNER